MLFNITGTYSLKKEYFVIDWQTGLIQAIRYEGESLAYFILKIAIQFKKQNCKRLYVLYPNTLHEHRQHIDTTAKLHEVLTYINENSDDPEAIRSLYIYPWDESP